MDVPELGYKNELELADKIESERLAGPVEVDEFAAVH